MTPVEQILEREGVELHRSPRVSPWAWVTFAVIVAVLVVAGVATWAF